jgi:hypothetical protein
MRHAGLASQPPSAIALLLLAAATLTIVAAGCEKHTPLAGGYEFIRQPDVGPDSHPGAALGYHGKQVWPNVDPHTFVDCKTLAAFVHGDDDVIVFLIALPDDDKEHLRYTISPQLVAMRRGGVPMVLSERILGHSIRVPDDGVVCKLIPSAAGMHVEFSPGPEPDAAHATSAHDIPWTQIGHWLDTPESLAPTIVKPLGTYRILPPLQTPASGPSGS